MSQQKDTEPAAVPADVVAPLIHIPLATHQSDLNADKNDVVPPPDVCSELVASFQNSGFLRISTPLVPLELQKRALQAATAHLVQKQDASSSTATATATQVVTHPTDPKSYCMLTSPEDIASISPILAEYAKALDLTKVAVLRCLAIGLDLPDPNYFVRLHSENNSSLRLLRYPATKSEDTGNRCKEHSDYGTITLLLTDGVSGLEAYHQGQWLPVPHYEGCLVVNAGSLMEKWTNGKIPATLHRVAGPASKNSCSLREDLFHAVGRDRTSIAYFADPDKGAKAELQQHEEQLCDESNTGEGNSVEQMSVAEYIRWRSGGDNGDGDRSGIGFTEEEERRLHRS